MGGRRVIGEKYEKRLEGAKLLIQRYGMVVIFIFALLPLPDDIILIPLGMLRYDLKKALVAAFLGKVAMCTIIANAGYYSFTYIKGIFESGGIIGGIVSVVILIIILVMMIRIDWARLIDVKEINDQNPQA
jgi:membrane protein DedA with SNARE-associated domain